MRDLACVSGIKGQRLTVSVEVRRTVVVEGKAMMLGTIRLRHLLRYAVTIIREYGIRKYCRCLVCAVNRRVTTFLEEVMR